MPINDMKQLDESILQVLMTSKWSVENFLRPSEDFVSVSKWNLEGLLNCKELLISSAVKAIYSGCDIVA